MGAILDALLRLQRVEQNLNSIRSRQQRIRMRIEAAERQIQENNTARQAHQQRIQRCQMEIDKAELDINSFEESMAKHRVALNKAKTNKEYAAILTALNTEKADASKRESRILQLMSEMDTLKGESRQFDETEKRLRERIDKHRRELDEQIEKTRDKVEALEQQRAEAEQNVPPSALQTFKRISGHHEGEGLAEVMRIGSRGHDYACSGCNMSVPLELVNRLRSRDELQLCQSCGRILCMENTANVNA